MPGSGTSVALTETDKTMDAALSRRHRNLARAAKLPGVNPFDTYRDNMRTLSTAAESMRDFCLRVGLKFNTINQYMHERMIPSESYRRSMEETMGVPAGCLDIPDGVKQHLPAIQSRFSLAPTKNMLLSPVRRKNLLALFAPIDTAGPFTTPSAQFCRALGLKPHLVSDLSMARAGSKKPTTELCRAVEASLGMPEGQLDLDIESGMDAFLPAVEKLLAHSERVPEIRRENLRNLSQLCSTRLRFCEIAKVTFDSLSQAFVLERGVQLSAICRHIEGTLGLRSGCLDTENGFFDQTQRLTELFESTHVPFKVRSTHLTSLVEMAGSMPELEEALGAGLSKTTQLRRAYLHPASDPPRSELCRQLEVVLGLPEGAMDVAGGLMAHQAVLSAKLTGRTPSTGDTPSTMQSELSRTSAVAESMRLAIADADAAVEALPAFRSINTRKMQ